MTIMKNFTLTHKNEYHLGSVVKFQGRSNTLIVTFGGEEPRVFNRHSNTFRNDLMNYLEENTSCYWAEKLIEKIAAKIRKAVLNGI